MLPVPSHPPFSLTDIVAVLCISHSHSIDVSTLNPDGDIHVGDHGQQNPHPIWPLWILSTTGLALPPPISNVLGLQSCPCARPVPTVIDVSALRLHTVR